MSMVGNSTTSLGRLISLWPFPAHVQNHIRHSHSLLLDTHLGFLAAASCGVCCLHQSHLYSHPLPPSAPPLHSRFPILLSRNLFGQEMQRDSGRGSGTRQSIFGCCAPRGSCSQPCLSVPFSFLSAQPLGCHRCCSVQVRSSDSGGAASPVAHTDAK